MDDKHIMHSTNSENITMIKLIFCLRRLPHLSREEFQEYWRNHHAPLVAERAAALGIRRYVQCHTSDPAGYAAAARVRGGAQAYDGVAELWFDSLTAMQAAGATTEGRRAGRELLEDERRFVDLPNSPLWLSEERVVVG